MVGGHEALNMQTSRTTGSHHDCLSLDVDVFFRLHVVQDSAGRMAVLVENQLNRRGEFDHLNIVGPVAAFIADGAHDFRAGDIGCVMHPLTRSTTTVDRLERAVGILREIAAVLLQPLNDRGSLESQRLDQFRLILEVTAAHDIEIMEIGRVLVWLGGSLNAALSHHGVGITVTQLGRDQDFAAGFLSQERCRSTGTTGADNQNVRFVIDLREVDLRRLDTALGFEQIAHFVRDRIAFRRTDLEFATAFVLDIGMEIEDFGPFVERHERHFLVVQFALYPLFARAFNNFDQLL